MKKLFEKVLIENRKYVEMVNNNDERQVEQLSVCSGLMNTILNLGLSKEYGEFVKNK